MDVFTLFGTITLKGINTVNQQLTGLQDKVKTTGETMTKLGTQMTSAGQGMERMGRKLSLFVSAPLLAAATAALKFAGDFDIAMRSINVELGASAEEIANYKKQILDLSNTTGISATDITHAFGTIVSAGYSGAEAIDILTVAIKGALGGQADAVAITEALTKVMKIFSLEGAAGASRAMDILFATMKSGTLSFDEMEGAFATTGTLAAGLGISFQETAAALASLSRITGSGEEGATHLRATLSDLLSPSEALQTLYKEWGVTTGTEAIKKFGGLSGVLREIQTETSGDINKLSELFTSFRSIQAVLPLVTTSSNDLSNSMKDITNSTGAASAAYNEMAAGPGFTLNLLTTNLKNSMTALGDSIAVVVTPWLTTLIEKVQGAVTWFQNLDSGTQKFIITVGGILIALGPVLIMLGQVAQGIGTLIRVVPIFASLIFKTLIPALVRATVSFITMLASMGPPGWVILAGAGVAAAAAIAALVGATTGGGAGEYGQGMVRVGEKWIPREEFAAGYNEATGEYTPTSYQGGGPIREETLLYGLKSRQVYARAHENERVTPGNQLVPIIVHIHNEGPWWIREEADIAKIAEQQERGLRSTLRRSGIPRDEQFNL